MKYKFVSAQITRCPSVVQWGWLIDNELSLLEFLEHKGKIQVEAYLRAKQKGDGSMGNHFVGIEGAFYYIIKFYDENPDNPRRKGLIDDLKLIEETFTMPVIKVFRERGEILAWRNLFSFAPTGGYTYLKEVDSDVLVFPDECYTEDDIKITCWPGGRHWYAKLGNKDVVINNEVKWNSYDRAEEAANEYLESYKQQCQ